MSAPTDDEIDAIAFGAFRPPAGGADGPDDSPDEPETDIDPGLLADYRGGALDDTAAADIERRLAAEASGRALLVEMAEPVPPFLLAWARRQMPSRRAWRPWLAGGMALAAAAVVLFMVLGRRPPPPDYGIDAVRGLVHDTRSDGPRTGPDTLVSDGLLQLVLRPGDAREAAPPVRVFVVVDGVLRAPEGVDVEAGEGGAVRVRATGRALFGEVFGPGTVWIAVGPDVSDAVIGRSAADAQSDADHARWLRFDVVHRPVDEEVP